MKNTLQTLKKNGTTKDTMRSTRTTKRKPRKKSEVNFETVAKYTPEVKPIIAPVITPEVKPVIAPVIKPIIEKLAPEPVYIFIYWLCSVNADRAVKRVGDFKKGKWVRVPRNLYCALNDAVGWKGKVEKERIK